MPRRQFLPLTAAVLTLLILSLYFSQRWRLPRHLGAAGQRPIALNQHDIPDNGMLNQSAIAAYLDAILDLDSTALPHLECPAIDRSRYGALRQHSSFWATPDLTHTIEFFFVLNLRECLPLLPRLMGSIVEAVRFLGPHRCAVSIVEGHSRDGSHDVLAALGLILGPLGTPYYFNVSGINSRVGDRISKLANLRNEALRPLLESAEAKAGRVSAEKTSVIFINDVAICTEDILELIHQRRLQSADMVCAFDWVDKPDVRFYDVWVARDRNGETFYPIPSRPEVSWEYGQDLFWDDPDTRARFDAHQPFQVYACWNGAVVFTAAPIVLEAVKFRRTRLGECYQGEPQLFCKDLWWHGWRRIAVVPSVNLEYTDDKARLIKQTKGYASELVHQHRDAVEEKIDWLPDPPEMVRCMPSWEHQYFEPWNVSMED